MLLYYIDKGRKYENKTDSVDFNTQKQKIRYYEVFRVGPLANDGFKDDVIL